MAIPCSEGLQAAYAPVLRTFTKTGGSGAGATLSSTPGAGDWRTSRPSCPRTGTPVTSCRSPASATGSSGGQQHSGSPRCRRRLPQRCRAASGNRSAGNALPGYGIYTGAGQVHSGAREQHGPLSFENALETLTRELDNPATPLADYQARRQALGTWCIDEDTWTNITARLPPGPGPQQPDLGDRKRQLASIYVWVQVTSGEHLFAPRPIEAIMPPSLRKPWTQWTSAWKLLDPGHPGPHYTNLKAELGTIATSLARTIDSRG